MPRPRGRREERAHDIEGWEPQEALGGVGVGVGEEEEGSPPPPEPPSSLGALVQQIQERSELRRDHRWEEADVIRDELKAAGVVINDRSGTWQLGKSGWRGEVGGAHWFVGQKKKKKTNSKEAARNRHRVFVEFLVSTFGRAMLAEGGGVLDIAGGKGLVAAELRDVHGVPCTVVEPRSAAPVRTSGAENGGVTELRDLGVPRFEGQFSLHQGSGGAVGDESRLEEMCRGASCLVGMHPDQVTEAIVDTALRLGKPMAVVPCCVFRKLFPERRVAGRPVVTYEDLIEYLVRKGDGMMEGNLNFFGRHRVVFHLGDGVEAPAALRAESERLGGERMRRMRPLSQL